MTVHLIQCHVNRHLPSCQAIRRFYAPCQKYMITSICTVWCKDVTNLYLGVIHVDGALYHVDCNNYQSYDNNFTVTHACTQPPLSVAHNNITM